MSKEIVELAVLIKHGNSSKTTTSTTEKSSFPGFFVGTVEVAPPDIQIRLSPEVILYNDNLIISAAVLKEYEREFEIFDAEIELDEGVKAATAKGKIKWTDELKQGDKVILVPAQNENLYILIEKAVEL